MSDSAVPAGQLSELTVGDASTSWERAGFVVVDDTVRLGDVTVRLVGPDGGRGIRSWSLHGIDGQVDGLWSRPPGPVPADGTTHPNGVTTVDHLVIETDDFARTVPAFEAVGLELRRTRTFDFGDGERQQCFFWMGSVILELIGRVEPAADAAPPARFWGLALISPDLDATAAHLGDVTSAPKDAVQKGRRISTLRTRDLDISVPVAFMSPHVAG